MSISFKGLSKLGLLARNYTGAEFLESENWPKSSELMKVCEFDKSYFPFPWSDDSWTDTQISSKNYLLSTLCDQSGALKAFCLWKISLEEELFHLLKVVVYPEMRGIGLGEILLEGIMGFSRSFGIKRFYLEVEEGNRSAIRLYEKVGFHKLHLAKNFYGNSRNGFKMLKSLE